jgi:mRNA-degrading endonuclease RelE of RelBE toxin-antitoxin system
LPKLRLKNPAREAWEALSPEALEAVDLALLKIQANPTEEGEPLVGRMRGKWRKREGGYRIIYEIKERGNLVMVESIQKRPDAYPRLSHE